MAKRTQEFKDRISEANKGLVRTPEQVENLRKALKESPNVQNNMQRLAKLRQKPIQNTNTGEVYESIKLAGKELGVAPSSISDNLRGKTKTCLGAKWIYISKEDYEKLKP